MTSGTYLVLTEDERHYLLTLARRAIEAATSGRPLPQPDTLQISALLHEPGACFVTLRKGGALRGCTGVLVARQPLAEEVLQTAAQTALHDPRFAPVTLAESHQINIEVSVLTPPTRLQFQTPDELLQRIRPRVDGVTLRRGPYRATFLPQVWETIPDPSEFLSRLCEKMGLPPNSWLQPGMEVEIYQVQEFAEESLVD